MPAASHFQRESIMAPFHAVSRQRKYADSFFILTAFSFLLLAIFHAWPMIDVRVSEWFFSGPICQNPVEGSCGSFTLSAYPPIIALRSIHCHISARRSSSSP
jgi:hypothetical protein